MNVYEQRRAEVLILQPTGRLDSLTSQDLQSELSQRISGGDTAILLDLKDLDYISSAGLRVLLLAGKELKAKNGQLSLCALKENVREVFEISGFISLFPIHSSVDEAIGTSSS